MRLHLVNPASRLWGIAGREVTPEFYLSLMTIHGTIMVFFVLSNAPMSAFGHLFLPYYVGSRQMAFPLIGPISFWLTAVSFCLLLATLHLSTGAPLSGWTAYPPLSAVGEIAGPG